MSASHDLGRHAERLAAAHLENLGWTVVTRNYRLGHKEIDLVARRHGVVAFIEVKARTSPDYGHPLAAINGSKRLEIQTVARAWIARHGRAGEVYRFDAVAVHCHECPVRIEHVPDAWRA
jgi:putative endonuclease